MKKNNLPNGIVAFAADDVTNAVVETARRLGIVFGVEAWESSGERLGSEAHLERLDGLVGANTGGSVVLATDERQIEDMVAAAGPIVASQPNAAGPQIVVN